MTTGADAPGPVAPARTSGLAIASLALGVVGLVAVPVIASILAVVLGASAQREIERDPSLGGEGYARGEDPRLGRDRARRVRLPALPALRGPLHVGGGLPAARPEARLQSGR